LGACCAWLSGARDRRMVRTRHRLIR